MNVKQAGFPANEGARLIVGDARLSYEELLSILIRVGHPRPQMSAGMLMRGTSRPPVVVRTAQDTLNEMELVKTKKRAEVTETALRRILSPLTVKVLDVVSQWRGSASVAGTLGISQTHASNILARLLDLGLIERKAMGHDRRIRLYRSRLVA